MELTDKQQRFIEEYCVDCNGTQAAKRAGYSAESARSIAHENLTKPDIRAAIDERLKQLAMSADEAVKHISDIASTRLNDYLKIVERTRIPTREQPLEEAIEEAEAEIAFEQEYTTRSLDILSFADEEERKGYLRQRNGVVNKLRLQQLRWELELKNFPGATRDVPDTPVTYEDIQVDMVALAKASTLGRIKSLSFGEYGPKVEMYAADGALRDILKLNGRFVERTDITSGGKAITAQVEVVPAGPPIATSEKEDV